MTESAATKLSGRTAMLSAAAADAIDVWRAAGAVTAASSMARMPLAVTTSWDDGHVLDHRMADLLRRYAVPATFYVAPENVELSQSERLTVTALKELAAEFEIGGHTLTHRRLTTLPDAEARSEIISGKQWLEDEIGQEVSAFCYVGGKYAPRHVPMVREAGFRMARTTRRLRLRSADPFEQDTTVQAFRHLVDGPAVARLSGFALGGALRRWRQWDELAIALFDRALLTGGVFHLWGHSWELGSDDWRRLERVLDHVGQRPDVTYVPNGALADLRS